MLKATMDPNLLLFKEEYQYIKKQAKSEAMKIGKYNKCHGKGKNQS